MKTIDLATERPSVEDILQLAEQDNLVVRTPDGKVFIVAEVDEHDDDEDFTHEVALTRHNQTLRALLAERSQEPGRHTLDQVRQKLGITTSSK